MRVFVYGSLRQGCHNHGYMDDADLVGSATTVDPFHLADLGAYPGMVDAYPGDGVNVVGEVYEVESLHRLDRLENHPSFYCRRVISVRLAEGSETRAWAYILPARWLNGCPMVESGDWLDHLAKRCTIR